MLLVKAIANLRPQTVWILHGEDYESLEWLDKNSTKPTEEELIAEVEKLKAEYSALEYSRLRAKEYPSIIDQLDLMYHGGYDAWKDMITTIKSKYPK